MGEVCAPVVEESQFLSFHGIGIHYRVISPEDAPRERILLLSSPLINTFHWRKLVPELIQLGCLTVIADLPGFGRSDCSLPAPHSSLMRANIFWGLLDEVDRQSNSPGSMWHLCGHGSSCATILEMGQMYPDSVKSQIHISPLVRIPPLNQDHSPIRWYRETILVKDAFRRMVEHCSGYPMDDYILDRMRMPLLRQGARENFLRMLRAGKAVPQCSLGFCPAMVLTGGRDTLMTEPARKDLQKYFSGAEFHTLKSAGHFPMETHSKALRDYLRGWIRYNAQPG